MMKSTIVTCFYLLGSTILFSQTDNMNSSNFNLNRTVLVRIGGVTIGVNKNEMGLSSIVFKDETAIIGERLNGGYHLIGNAEFTLSNENEYWVKNLREAFLFLPIPKDGSDSTMLDRFYPLPDWLTAAKEIEHLTLNQVTLKDSYLMIGQQLKVLILGKVQIENRDKLIRYVTTLNSLEYLVHDLIFTPSEIEEMKKSKPTLNIMLAREYEAGIDSGKIIR